MAIVPSHCDDCRVPDGTIDHQPRVPTGTKSRKNRVAAKPPNTSQKSIEESAVRQRILEAAFSAFMEGGYAATSTLQIASRAHVSKRALYELVGNKQEMLAACIGERAKRL